MFSKTQVKIMELFTSKITGIFSIKEVSELTKKPYPLIHRSIKDLVVKKFILKDSRSFLSLNYKANYSSLAYIESIRCEEFLKRNKAIALFVNDSIERMGLGYFTLLLFGSSVQKGEKARDVDILLIVPHNEDVSQAEKLLNNISSNFTVPIHCNVISTDSVREMLAKRDEVNVMNETLDNHILFFGAENYYELLKNAR
ncbi:Uncharacterised protein [uncultured archaeon]|nr:Uncharacterised protein [uncultured archaeon]